ncbi:MAG: septation protein SpoVG family protein [Candidatus Omnitrophica bacterium]|nr:septation protein SpoVG family protein [Candidatus Omnitrophota bacterium]
MSFNVLDFKVVKIHCLPEGNRIKAFVDLGVNDLLLIKGLRIVRGNKGLFVSMPQEQGKNERWYERVRCLSKEVEGRIHQKVLEAYKAQPVGR